MKISEVMSEDLACCTPDAPLYEAAKLMAQNDCGAIPVVKNKDDMRLTGIITDRDIVVRCIAAGKNLSEAKVGDCMTPRVFTANVTDDLQSGLPPGK